jgi:branched-chain amino acid transport system ATP-binding protein
MNTGAMNTGAALETSLLNMRFGSLTVASDINFRLMPGARHALIGPNGAGKTTFLNLLTGQLAPTSGTVRLNGEDVTRLPVHRRVQRGLARTFQINTLLREMTVLEGVQLAVLEHWGMGRRLLGGAAVQRRAAERAYDLLDTLRLADHAGDRVAALAYGRQRLVEVAIALAMEPTVLLLDEPAAGVPPADSHLVLDLIANLPAAISVLIIEHDMKLVFRFAQRISVLVQGKILTEGTPAEIAADPLVREVYLGTRHHG